VILLEELEEFVGMSPLGFVVVLDDERMVRSRLCKTSNWEEKRREQKSGQQAASHGISLE